MLRFGLLLLLYFNLGILSCFSIHLYFFMFLEIIEIGSYLLLLFLQLRSYFCSFDLVPLSVGDYLNRATGKF
jgi:hypothetical protein